VRWWLASLWVAVVIWILPTPLDNFCFRQMRLRSEQDYIDVVVREEITKPTPVMASIRSPADFYAKFPDCCRIYGWMGGDVVVLVK
jgi:hypothetical protein